MDGCLGFDKLGKDFRVLHGNLSENLAVELDVALFQAVHEFGIDCSVQTGGSVDTHLLETAIVALLEFASDVGVAATLCGSCLGERDLGFAAPHHALCTGKNILAALDAVCTALNTRHRS